jgi:hypothetical protein
MPEVRWICGGYRNIVRQLLDLVGAGTFVLVHADCPLKDLFNTPLPGDVVNHAFKCTYCGQQFSMYADTCHGHGAWMPRD